MVKTEKLVDLKGSLKHTTSSAQIKSDGSPVIELYDFSSEAEKWLGNEVAFLIKVFARDKSKMLSCLLEGQKQMLDESQEDDLLPQLIQGPVCVAVLRVRPVGWKKSLLQTCARTQRDDFSVGKKPKGRHQIGFSVASQ